MLADSSPDLDGADRALAPLVTASLVASAVADVPDSWLVDEPGFADVAEVRDAYIERITARLAARDAWLPPLRAAIEGRAVR